MWVTGQKDQVQNHRSASLHRTAPLMLAERVSPHLPRSEGTGKDTWAAPENPWLAVEMDPMLYAHSSTFSSDVVR